MRKSSFHYDKGYLGFCYHNDRSKPTVNSIFDESKNEYSHKAKEAIEIYRKELQKRSLAYTQRTGKRLNKRTLTHLSAIVNLDKRHTLEDVKKVAEFLEEDLGTKVFQIAVHKDEGYIDEYGRPHINYHAHVEFLGLDENGNSVRRKLDKKRLSHIQDKVAEILGMPRGINYIKERKKRPRRLNTYEYKEYAKRRAEALKSYDKAILNAYLRYKLQGAEDPIRYKDFLLQKLAEKDKSFVEEFEAFKQYTTETDPQTFLESEVEEIAKVKDLKEENKKLREQLKEAGAKREHYAQLEQFVKKLKEDVKGKELTIKELKEKMKSKQEELLKQIADLQEKEKEKEEELQKLRTQNNEAEKLKEELQEKNEELMQLRPQLETTKKKNEKLEQEIQAEKERSARYMKALKEAAKIAVSSVGGRVTTLDELIEKLKEMSIRLKELEEQLQETERELAEYKGLRYIERKQSDFDPKEARRLIKELQAEIGKVKTENESLKGKIEELQAENRRLRAKNDNLKAEIEEMMEDRGYGMGY